MENDINKLKTSAMIVVALASIVLVAISMVTQYDKTLRQSTNTSITDFTLGAENDPTSVGTPGQYPYLQDVTDCINATNKSKTLSRGAYTVQEGNENGGTITVKTGQLYAGNDVNCSISYLAETTTSQKTTYFTAGLTVIGTFIVIVILSLIGKVIVGIFRKER